VRIRDSYDNRTMLPNEVHMALLHGSSALNCGAAVSVALCGRDACTTNQTNRDATLWLSEL